jgi:hypothetical protein
MNKMKWTVFNTSRTYDDRHLEPASSCRSAMEKENLKGVVSRSRAKTVRKRRRATGSGAPIEGKARGRQNEHDRATVDDVLIDLDGVAKVVGSFESRSEGKLPCQSFRRPLGLTVRTSSYDAPIGLNKTQPSKPSCAMVSEGVDNMSSALCGLLRVLERRPAVPSLYRTCTPLIGALSGCGSDLLDIIRSQAVQYPRACFVTELHSRTFAQAKCLLTRSNACWLMVHRSSRSEV